MKQTSDLKGARKWKQFKNSTMGTSIPLKGLKTCVIGDGAIGKTCLLCTFATKEFPTKYIPTVSFPYSGLTKT